VWAYRRRSALSSLRSRFVSRAYDRRFDRLGRGRVARAEELQNQAVLRASRLLRTDLRVFVVETSMSLDPFGGTRDDFAVCGIIVRSRRVLVSRRLDLIDWLMR